MITHSSWFLTTAALCLLSASSLAQLPPKPAPPPPPAPPTKPLDGKAAQELLDSLAKLEALLEEKRNEKNKEALTAFTDAVTSDDKAHDLYMQCKRQVDFEDKGRSKEWNDWRSSPQGKSAHDQEHCAVLRLQIQWLILTIRASTASDTTYSQIVNDIPPVLATILEKWKRMEGFHQKLEENVIDSVFGRFFRLDQTLERRKSWVYSPGEIDQIYESILLPYYRSQKSLALLNSAWSARIAQLTELVRLTSERGDEAQINFTSQKLPTLQWGMARDNFVLGNETTASPQLMSIIKSNLGHRQADKWIEEFTALLKGEPVASSEEEEIENLLAPATPPAPEPPPATAETTVPPASPPAVKPGGTLMPIDEEAPAEPTPAPEPAPVKKPVDF